MKEIAQVVKTTGKIAVLQIEKHPACDGCKICAFKDGKSRVKVKARNLVGAKAGDHVIVSAEKDNRLLASFVAYIVPVLFACLGLLLGWLTLKKEVFCALFCIAGLIVGFTAVALIDKLLSRTRGFGMEVIEIVDIIGEKADEVRALDHTDARENAGEAGAQNGTNTDAEKADDTIFFDKEEGKNG